MSDNHDGYGGAPGTYLMREGKRMKVGAEILTLTETPIPVPSVEKTKSVAEPVKKTESDANLTE